MNNIKPNQIYRHYKGNIYKVLGLAKHTETLETLVIYEDIVKKLIWARPISMWNNIIKNPTNGKKEKRFKLIKGANIKHE